MAPPAMRRARGRGDERGGQRRSAAGQKRRAAGARAGRVECIRRINGRLGENSRGECRFDFRPGRISVRSGSPGVAARVGGGQAVTPRRSMQLRPIRIHRRRRLLRSLALSTLVGLLAAAMNTGSRACSRRASAAASMQVAAATTHVFVDTADAVGGAPRRISRQRADQARGAARPSDDQPARASSASAAAGIVPAGRSAPEPARAPTCPLRPDRAGQRGARQRHRTLRPAVSTSRSRRGRDTPVLDVYTEAPSAAQATRLADAGDRRARRVARRRSPTRSRSQTDAPRASPPARARAWRRRQRRHVDGDRAWSPSWSSRGSRSSRSGCSPGGASASR